MQHGTDHQISTPSAQVVHRDLKPQNVLLDAAGHVRICDFGVSRARSKGHGGAGRESMSGGLGTPAYMAPEMMTGAGGRTRYSPAVDVYSLGVLIWELVHQRQPYADEAGIKQFALMFSIQSGHRPPIGRGCSLGLRELLEACWAPDPADRPSVPEIRRRLEDGVRIELQLPD